MSGKHTRDEVVAAYLLKLAKGHLPGSPCAIALVAAAGAIVKGAHWVADTAGELDDPELVAWVRELRRP